jgi:hypothetical protein
MHETIVKNPQKQFPVFPSYIQAVRAMLPALFFNPGVGLNAN